MHDERIVYSRLDYPIPLLGRNARVRLGAERWDVLDERVFSPLGVRGADMANRPVKIR